MPYLNLDPNYPDHPKTVRLKGWLGETGDIYPIRLWAYCARMHPKDGHMKGYSVAEVEAVLRWHGAPGTAVEALMAVGFILKTENGFKCHDWKEHEGHLDAFSRRGVVAARARWSRYASSIPKALLNGDLSNAPSNLTIPSKPAIPTFEELSAYCKERGGLVDPQKWFDFYTSKGWMIGKNRMKDWKAAVRTWERNNGNRGNGGAASPVRTSAQEGKYAGLEREV